MHGINSITILQWQKKAKPRHGNCTGGGAVSMSHKGGCPEPALSVAEGAVRLDGKSPTAGGCSLIYFQFLADN